jgi:pyridoxamine 5'-phosphate oxidase
MNLGVAEIRLRFASQPLSRRTISPDPFAQFDTWYAQAKEAKLFQANAMTLATVTADGEPAARMVLLHEFDERGFVFFTSYESRKAHELELNPKAALVVWWGPLFRQVRIEGAVTELTAAECDVCFATRPREHQLETWAFRQSQVIEDRAELIRRMQELKAEYSESEIPRPADFGGYRLAPTLFEFWQGRTDWLHDSLRYAQRSKGIWVIERLAP